MILMIIFDAYMEYNRHSGDIQQTSSKYLSTGHLQNVLFNVKNTSKLGFQMFMMYIRNILNIHNIEFYDSVSNMSFGCFIDVLLQR